MHGPVRITQPAAPQPEVLPRRHKFTVAEVLQMAEHGTLPDVRCQLIDGDLIEMAPQGPEHASLVTELNHALYRAYRGREFCIRPALPLLIKDVSTLPEPDLAVVMGSGRQFRERHPRGDEAVLVIEVAVTSQQRDQGKVARYAAAGVPEYWIVDVKQRQTTRYQQPRNGAYEQSTQVGFGLSLTLPVAGESLRMSDFI